MIIDSKTVTGVFAGHRFVDPAKDRWAGAGSTSAQDQRIHASMQVRVLVCVGVMWSPEPGGNKIISQPFSRPHGSSPRRRQGRRPTRAISQCR
jgi:hypothetical protein